MEAPTHPPGAPRVAAIARVRAAARAAGAAAVVVYLTCAFTPLTRAWYAAMAIEPELRPADAIVVLGTGVTPEGELTGNSMRRTVHGIRLYRQGLAPWIVLLGAENRGAVEADVRAHFAVDLGVPASALIVERRGRTTRDEARLVAARLASGRPATVLLVTSLQHMPRARQTFESAGLVVLPAPVPESALTQGPEHRLALARALAQETLARAYYRMVGGF